jgi:hypothetical protein
LSRILYHTKSEITTSDNYQIKIKAYCTYQSQPSEDTRLSDLIDNFLGDYFAETPLLEALEYIEEEKSKLLESQLLNKLKDNLQNLIGFHITSVDATELQEKINYTIDPDLEPKKKRGFLSKFRKKK